jgi:hypothetical protein
MHIVFVPSLWGMTPEQCVAAEYARRGKPAVVSGCARILEGRDSDALLFGVGGPYAR